MTPKHRFCNAVFIIYWGFVGYGLVQVTYLFDQPQVLRFQFDIYQ